MKCDDRAVDLLPLYVAGTLARHERGSVEAHLAVCAICQADLALWTSVATAARQPNVAAEAAAPRCARALAKVPSRQPPATSRAWTLLAAQVPLVGADIWSASALVMAIGYVVAALMRQQSVLDAVAPLAAAGAVAAVCGPACDPAFEITRATPTKPRQVLLARLVLVFGYNLGLALAASLALGAVLPNAVPVEMVTGWLAPMTFLSALALVLSLVVGTGNASAVAFGLWCLRGLPVSYVQFSDVVQAAAMQYQRAWHEPVWLAAGALALVATAAWLAGRTERQMTLVGLRP